MNKDMPNLMKLDIARICTAPGIYEEFQIVNGKGLFCNFRKTNTEFKFTLESIIADTLPVFAIYKKSGLYSVLVCAFNSKEEINAEAKEIIKSNAIIRNSLEGLLEY